MAVGGAKESTALQPRLLAAAGVPVAVAIAAEVVIVIVVVSLASCLPGCFGCAFRLGLGVRQAHALSSTVHGKFVDMARL